MNNNSNVEWGDYTKEIIDLNNISKSNKLDNITVSDNKIVIKNSGVYEFTGSFNGKIEVLTQVCNVSIIFNGVDLTSVDGSALYISASNDVLLTIEGGENKVSDTNNYSNEDINGTIYSESNLTIDGGSISITSSYEGLEASTIYINNGNISVVSTDDGINAASSNESSEDNFRRDSFSNSTGTIYINGGTVYINSYGDGLDSNGNIDMTNDSVIIDGPTNAGNGAIDYDGTFNISGGTLIALGSTGMDEAPSSTPLQYILHFNTSNNEANTNIILTDEENNEIINYTPSKSYSSIVISDSSIKKEGIYTIKIGGSEFASVTATDIITNYGSRSNIGGMMIPGNRREQ